MTAAPLCAGCIYQHIEKNEALCARKYVLTSTDHSTGHQFKCFTLCTPCSYERSRISNKATGEEMKGNPKGSMLLIFAPGWRGECRIRDVSKADLIAASNK